MVMDKHFMFSHIIYMGGSQPHFGLVLTKTNEIASATGPLKMSRGRFLAPRLIELESGAPPAHHLASLGGCCRLQLISLGSFFFYENWVLINGQGRGGWDIYIYIWSTPKPMMVNNINMKGTMIQSWSSCHIRGVADLHMGGAWHQFVTHGLLINGGNHWWPRVYLIEVRIMFHTYVQWILIARSGEFF